MKPLELSIVSPVFRAAPVVAELVRRILLGASAVTANFEIVLVDDGSPDGSWDAIVAAAQAEPRVKGIRLSRNFGQHRAITAGLAHASGDAVIVMDCDLQDDPSYIPAFVAKAHSGYDIVLAHRPQRRHSWMRNLTAGMFVRLFNALTDRRSADLQTGGYSLLNRKVVDAFLRIGDMQRHYLLVLGWMGFATATIPVEHRSRHAGRSSYNLRRLVAHAVEGITSQSTKLLQISIVIGLAYFVAALVGVAYLTTEYYRHGFLAGWPSTIVILLASTSLILMSLGIVGLYIGNIFEQVRGRPLYLVQDRVNFDPARP